MTLSQRRRRYLTDDVATATTSADEPPLSVGPLPPLNVETVLRGIW